MAKRGANGVVGTREGEALLSGGAGTYAVHDRQGNRLGRVLRRRHTIRIPFTGKQYGYDTSHWCWDGEFDTFGHSNLRCYPTMSRVVELMLRELKEV